MIPKILHFCYFGQPGESERPFPLISYIAIRSAIHFINPQVVYFYNTHEPGGKYWNDLRSQITRVQTTPPPDIFGRPLCHYAHQADVIRMQVLLEHGGIYLDLDTICCRPFDELLKYPSVMGIQKPPDGEPGLCNAVILSSPNNSFLNEWYQSYRSFRSKGYDSYWDEHSVQIPHRLARFDAQGRSGRTDLHIEPQESFFAPSFSPQELKQLFERNTQFPKTYCHHLWANKAKRYFDRLTERLVREVDTTYNRLARPFLPAQTS